MTAAEQVVVFPGLWGALRLTDRVPPYRRAGDDGVPALEGRLGALWRPVMRDALRLEARNTAEAGNRRRTSRPFPGTAQQKDQGPRA